MAKKQRVDVPPHFIKDAPVDWAGEIFAASGLPLVLSPEVSVPPPSYGVWALLELLDCDFVHPVKTRTDWGACIALGVACLGREAIPLVRDALAAGVPDNPPDLADLPVEVDDLTARCITICAHAEINPATAAAKLGDLYHHLNLAFSGYAMIPKAGGGGGGKYLFGLDAFAGVVATVGPMLQTTPDALMWDTPLCLIGHLVAAENRRQGAKGIKRPKDPEDVKLQLALAKDRAKRGVLHPWQEQEPHIYGKQGHETDDEAYRLAVLYNERLARIEREKAEQEAALLAAHAANSAEGAA